jgi:hypothetical protein
MRKGGAMPKYWWVSHSQTFTQEIKGNYLWSPKTEANGARSQFYDNMRLAGPNDLVLSFAHSQIAFIGRITDFAFSAPKPIEFGTTGSNWSADGWLLPVTWQPIRNPLRPKTMLEQLAPYLPSKYSPINPKTGNGNQKAYLAEIGRDVFHIAINRTGEELAPAEDSQLGGQYADMVTAIEQHATVQIEQNKTLSDTEKEQLIKARRGQGIFRSNVRLIENGCRVTGITNQRLLVASHIKPWRSCSDSHERLDGHNGLLLTPNADFLFDRGLISFSDSGELLLSSKIEQTDLERLGVKAQMVTAPSGFVAKQREYLEYHRTTIFIQ